MGKYIHRLVARAFLGLPPSREHWQVHHKYGDPSNNHVDNLEYVTPAQNIKHSYDLNTLRRTCAEILSRPVLASFVGDCNSVRYSSLNEAGRQLNLSPGNISKCCRGLSELTGGYEF